MDKTALNGMTSSSCRTRIGSVILGHRKRWAFLTKVALGASATGTRSSLANQKALLKKTERRKLRLRLRYRSEKKKPS